MTPYGQSFTTLQSFITLQIKSQISTKNSAMNLFMILHLLAILPAISDLAPRATKSFTPSNSGIYYVQLSIGTPAMTVNTAFNTMSLMSWVQIPECEVCFPVNEGVSYDPKNSSTFKVLSSGDPLYSPPFNSSSNGSCVYDDGFTSGFISKDKLRYSVGVGAYDFGVSREISFGCGLVNSIVIGGAKSGNPISSLIGLGLGHSSSLVHQLRPVMMGRFSYCIPSLSGNEGTLDFGAEAFDLTGDVQKTRLVLEPPPKQNYRQYYSLKVTGITVNGSVVSLPAQGLKFAFDTIASYNAMSKPNYQIFRDAILKHFLDQYRMAPLKRRTSDFELCYELEKYGGRAIFLSRAPAVGLQLKGGAYLELRNIFDSFGNEGAGHNVL